MSDRNEILARAFGNINKRLLQLEYQRCVNEGDLKDIQKEFSKVRREFRTLYGEIDELRQIVEELKK